VTNRERIGEFAWGFSPGDDDAGHRPLQFVAAMDCCLRRRRGNVLARADSWRQCHRVALVPALIRSRFLVGSLAGVDDWQVGLRPQPDSRLTIRQSIDRYPPTVTVGIGGAAGEEPGLVLSWELA